MPRPTAEDRRKDYLDIGAEIVTKFSAEDSAAATVDALANVKVADVADRAGVTKGAVYHVWPSQEAYRKDLLARLLEHHRQSGVREMADLLEDTDLVEGDPRTILQRHADFVFDTLKDDPAFFARFSFFIYAANPEVSELLARGDDAIIEDFGPYVEVYLRMIGRRIREPFSVGMLLTSVNALFMGLCLRYRTSPELVEPTGAEVPEHSMYAFGLEALVMHFSEPMPVVD
ncbi:MAG: TetR/AcrR family transcriptional regulator [Microthrixaceae bacterium]